MIVIDGSQGEGGGQILRSSLSLSGCTGQSFVLENIRAGRKKPGLMRQHLTCVLAAQQICAAEVEGAEVGSTTLRFRPGASPCAGRYVFPVGTAGSTTLVLQAVWPLLVAAGGTSHVVVTGGTHNPGAPPFDFLAGSFAPQLAKLGVGLEVSMSKYGFFPVGGGQIEAKIGEPMAATPVEAFDLSSRGELVRRHAAVRIVGLPRHIAERELDVVRKKLQFTSREIELNQLSDVQGTGNVLTITHEFENVTHVATGFGQLGVRAERVASRAIGEVRKFLAASDAPVGENLADQLLLPIALAGGGTFRTVEPTLHTKTNATIIERFTGKLTRIVPDGDGGWRITVT